MTDQVGSPTMNSVKKRLVIAIVLVAILVGGPLVVPRLVPWSPINCHDQEINVKTGQARYSRYLWYIKVSERVEDTILSRVLGGEVVAVADISPWHMVNRFSPGLHHSPHYKFHGALAQTREIELLFEMLEPDAQRKKQIVRDILKLWQTRGDYFEAERYLIGLSEEIPKERERKYPQSSPEAPSLGAIPAQPAVERPRTGG